MKNECQVWVHWQTGPGIASKVLGPQGKGGKGSTSNTHAEQQPRTCDFRAKTFSERLLLKPSLTKALKALPLGSSWC